MSTCVGNWIVKVKIFMQDVSLWLYTLKSLHTCSIQWCRNRIVTWPLYEVRIVIHDRSRRRTWHDLNFSYPSWFFFIRGSMSLPFYHPMSYHTYLRWLTIHKHKYTHMCLYTKDLPTCFLGLLSSTQLSTQNFPVPCFILFSSIMNKKTVVPSRKLIF